MSQLGKSPLCLPTSLGATVWPLQGSPNLSGCDIFQDVPPHPWRRLPEEPLLLEAFPDTQSSRRPPCSVEVTSLSGGLPPQSACSPRGPCWSRAGREAPEGRGLPFRVSSCVCSVLESIWLGSVFPNDGIRSMSCGDRRAS